MEAETATMTKAEAPAKEGCMPGEMVVGFDEPLEHPTVMPIIVTRDGKGSLEWYAKALAGEVVMQYNDTKGRVMHAVVRAGFGTLIGIEDYYPDVHIVQPLGEGEKTEGAPAKGSTYLYVTIPKGKGSCDEAVERMRECGATVVAEPEDKFYAARVGSVVDVYGVAWCFSHSIGCNEAEKAAEGDCKEKEK